MLCGFFFLGEFPNFLKSPARFPSFWRCPLTPKWTFSKFAISHRWVHWPVGLQTHHLPAAVSCLHELACAVNSCHGDKCDEILVSKIHENNLFFKRKHKGKSKPAEKCYSFIYTFRNVHLINTTWWILRRCVSHSCQNVPNLFKLSTKFETVWPRCSKLDWSVSEAPLTHFCNHKEAPHSCSIKKSDLSPISGGGNKS